MSDPAIQSARKFGLAILTIGIVSFQAGWLEMERIRMSHLLSNAEVLLNIYSWLEKKKDLPDSVVKEKFEHRFKSDICDVFFKEKKTKGFQDMGKGLRDNTRAYIWGEPQIYEINGLEFTCLDKNYAVTANDQADYKSQAFYLSGHEPNLALLAYYSVGEDEWAVRIPNKLLNDLGLVTTRWEYKVHVNKKVKWQVLPGVVALSTLKKRILTIIFESTGQRFGDPKQALEQFFLYPPENIALLGISIDRHNLALLIPLALLGSCFVFLHRTRRLETNNDSQTEVWVLLKPIDSLEKTTANIYWVLLFSSPIAAGWMTVIFSGGFKPAVENVPFLLMFLSVIFSEILLICAFRKISFNTAPKAKFNASMISKSDTLPITSSALEELPASTVPKDPNDPLAPKPGQQR